jgi:RNA polymerase sigma factor (TIGR02999 family)
MLTTQDAIALVYDEIRQLARAWLAMERRGHTLQATALVNEAYLRLAAQGEGRWADRQAFLGVAAHVARQVLVDHARRRARLRRGGDRVRVGLDGPGLASAPDHHLDLLELDEALTRLGERSERQARLVDLRFFGGLPLEQAADLLGVSRRTAASDWSIARAFLRRELASAGAGP